MAAPFDEVLRLLVLGLADGGGRTFAVSTGSLVDHHFFELPERLRRAGEQILEPVGLDRFHADAGKLSKIRGNRGEWYEKTLSRLGQEHARRHRPGPRGPTDRLSPRQHGDRSSRLG